MDHRVQVSALVRVVVQTEMVSTRPTYLYLHDEWQKRRRNALRDKEDSCGLFIL